MRTLILFVLALAPALALGQPPPEIPNPADAPVGSLWVFVTLTAILVVGGVAFWYRRQGRLTARTDGDAVLAALTEAQQLSRTLSDRDLPPDLRNEVDEVSREVHAVKARVDAEPQLQAVPMMLTKARSLRDRLIRVRARVA